MAFLKPQSPLVKGNDYFYPLTTADQVIMDGGYRLDQIVGKVEKSTVTLYQNGWSTAAPYSYSIMVKGLADDLNMKVLPHYPENFAEKQVLKEEFAKVSLCSRQGNIVTFECWDEVPSVDIDVDIEVNVLYPLEAAIDMNEIESRLPKLNYSIVGGLEEPAEPTENMIWVQTDENITEHVFRRNTPENPIEGMICIYFGNYPSPAEFSKIKINEVGCDEISPLNVKQYIDGVWKNVNAKSYINGKWIDWYTYIYQKGDLFESITNGWTTVNGRTDGYVNTGTYIDNGNSFTLSVNTQAQSIVRHTNRKINFKNIKCLYINATIDTGVAQLLITSDIPVTSTIVAETSILSSGIHYIETSTLDGEYYIAVQIVNGDGNYTSHSITVSEIYMEHGGIIYE